MLCVTLIFLRDASMTIDEVAFGAGAVLKNLLLFQQHVHPEQHWQHQGIEWLQAQAT